MRYDDDRIERLERTVDELRERVARLERPATAPAAPPVQAVPPAPPAPPPRPAAPPPPPREPFRAPSIDLEELLGGRVLAWAGALAVFIGAIFFLATALRRGWIDEPTRVVLAYLGSSVLLGLGLYLYERKGRTQASLALVAAAIGALYASTTAATTLYDLVDPVVGLFVAGLVGLVSTLIAVRWDSREIAGIGIIGALLSPVLVDSGTSDVALAFMAIALVSATGVLLWKKWDWLAAAAFVTSAPQLIAWLADAYDDTLPLALAVLGCFWVVYVVAAVGFELRVPTEKLRFSSASLLLADAILTSGAGWLMLDAADHGDAATGWVIGVAVVHVALGTATLRGRISREVSLLLLAVGIGLSAIGAALALDGPTLVAAWSVEAVLLAWLARRMDRVRGYVAAAGFVAAATIHTLAFDARPDDLVERPTASAVVAVLLVTVAAGLVSWLSSSWRREYRDAMQVVALAGLAYLAPVAFEGVWVVVAWAVLAIAFALLSERVVVLDGVAPIAFVGLAAAHTLLIEAPPLALRDGVDDLASAVLAIAATTVAAFVAARRSPEPLRWMLTLTGAAGAIYLPSIAIVDLTSTGELEPGQTPQVLLSAFWSAAGLAAVVVGLVRDDKRLRLGGLGLLGLAAAKVVVYDLAELNEIYRVLSLIALGLLLLAGAFAYQRMRHEVGGGS
ncbi:MAG TPA: DUF2339 domain-containing protein [Gaiellaceae bacterium]|nr:DUF2339 domain-containing protein [Gaiellaceae bacterium]